MTPCEKLGYKVGDKVVMLVDSPWYSKGDKGVIITESTVSGFNVDFNDQGNTNVLGDGCWYVNREKMKLIDTEELKAERDELSAVGFSLDITGREDELKEKLLKLYVDVGIVGKASPTFTGETFYPKGSYAKEVYEHPLFPIYMKAIEQAMYGKGERHGGCAVPFLKQPWKHYAKMHGRGFLTGQAAKKLEEAASTREGEPFTHEVLGAIVFAGMSVILEEEKKNLST